MWTEGGRACKKGKGEATELIHAGEGKGSMWRGGGDWGLSGGEGGRGGGGQSKHIWEACVCGDTP